MGSGVAVGDAVGVTACAWTVGPSEGVPVMSMTVASARAALDTRTKVRRRGGANRRMLMRFVWWRGECATCAGVSMVRVLCLTVTRCAVVCAKL